MSRPRPQFEQLEGRRLFAAYYVSPFGSDANAGSAEAPVRTEKSRFKPPPHGAKSGWLGKLDWQIRASLFPQS